MLRTSYRTLFKVVRQPWLYGSFQQPVDTRENLLRQALSLNKAGYASAAGAASKDAAEAKKVVKKSAFETILGAAKVFAKALQSFVYGAVVQASLVR